jgi:hypothetical protein
LTQDKPLSDTYVRKELKLIYQEEDLVPCSKVILEYLTNKKIVLTKRQLEPKNENKTLLKDMIKNIKKRYRLTVESDLINIFKEMKKSGQLV